MDMLKKRKALRFEYESTQCINTNHILQLYVIKCLRKKTLQLKLETKQNKIKKTQKLLDYFQRYCNHPIYTGFRVILFITCFNILLYNHCGIYIKKNIQVWNFAIPFFCSTDIPCRAWGGHPIQLQVKYRWRWCLKADNLGDRCNKTYSTSWQLIAEVQTKSTTVVIGISGPNFTSAWLQ